MGADDEALLNVGSLRWAGDEDAKLARHHSHIHVREGVRTAIDRRGTSAAGRARGIIRTGKDGYRCGSWFARLRFRAYTRDIDEHDGNRFVRNNIAAGSLAHV